ncbi:MAG: BlaI/MecI/CopY family transcriptional regulator [Trebonia sp.]
MARRVVAGCRVGDLESEILDLLWSAPGPLTGREVWERLGNRARAYTTVMTVLGRLAGKGLAQRIEEGREHRYRAAGTPDELTAQAIRSLLEGAEDPRAALAHFVGNLDDPELVADLTAALKRLGRSPGTPP